MSKSSLIKIIGLGCVCRSIDIREFVTDLRGEPADNFVTDSRIVEKPINCTHCGEPLIIYWKPLTDEEYENLERV